MKNSSAARSIIPMAAAVVIGTVGLVGCGPTASEAKAKDTAMSERALEAHANRLSQQAQAYLGDPWEQRFREQFWLGQHIHDSWNRCHLGENVSDEAMKLSGC